jgi:phosphoribosylformylglycinamidine synthase
MVIHTKEGANWNDLLKAVMADFAIVSREPIIREYDHEVQGNTMLKPLAGASGDAPQDGSVIRVDGSGQLVALAMSLLPEWGKTDPHLMGRACVDECVRQLIAVGTNPDRIAILDNFCVGNPDDASELGALVETTKGMAHTAEIYATPFVSGKDSFYNYFKTDEGPVSIPTTLLLSGFGIVEDPKHIIGSSVRKPGNKLCLVGRPFFGLRGSVFARVMTAKAGNTTHFSAPDFDEVEALKSYRSYHELVKKGVVLSAHDVSEGGLAVALAEMGFSAKAGIKVDLGASDVASADKLFGEAPGQIVFEIGPENAPLAEKAGFPVIGETTSDGQLVITDGATQLVDVPISELKSLWKNGLTPYY